MRTSILALHEHRRRRTIVHRDPHKRGQLRLLPDPGTCTTCNWHNPLTHSPTKNTSTALLLVLIVVALRQTEIRVAAPWVVGAQPDVWLEEELGGVKTNEANLHYDPIIDGHTKIL